MGTYLHLPLKSTVLLRASFLTLLCLSAQGLTRSSKSNTKITVNCNIHKDSVTVSGMSAGGNMAQVLHLSHPQLFSGVGIFSAPFYIWFDKRRHLCSTRSVECSLDLLRKYEAEGLIGSLSIFKSHRVFRWIGTSDKDLSSGKRSYTKQSEVPIARIYEKILVSTSQIRHVEQPGAHIFPSAGTGPSCQTPGRKKDPTDTGIRSCGFNGPLEMLQFLLSGKGIVDQSSDQDYKTLAGLHKFNQSAYFEGFEKRLRLEDEGYIYIPAQCLGKTDHCYLHIYLHGCRVRGPKRADDRIKYMEETGFLEVAEQNGIVVLFPMAKQCFDFWGYTGDNFGTRNGPQVRVLSSMVKRLLKEKRI